MNKIKNILDKMFTKDKIRRDFYESLKKHHNIVLNKPFNIKEEYDKEKTKAIVIKKNEILNHYKIFLEYNNISKECDVFYYVAIGRFFPINKHNLMKIEKGVLRLQYKKLKLFSSDIYFMSIFDLNTRERKRTNAYKRMYNHNPSDVNTKKLIYGHTKELHKFLLKKELSLENLELLFKKGYDQEIKDIVEDRIKKMKIKK